jgi:cobalamin biosynthesis Mg chelatase CobN
MSGTRQSLPRVRGRSILALSTLALLAFVCLPALAGASSAGYQYEDAPQTATGTGKPPSESTPTAGGSKATDGVCSKANGGSTDGGGAADGGKQAGGAKNQTSQASGGNKDGNAKQGAQSKGGGNPANPAGSTEPGSDGGDSSPLGPILVGIAILAGCSIAYLMYRRSQVGGDSDSPDSADSSGSSPSPEAG